MIRAGVFFYQSIFILITVTFALIMNGSKLRNIGKFICFIWSCYFVLHFTVFDYPVGGKIATYMFPKYRNISDLLHQYNFIPFRTIVDSYSYGIRTFVVQIVGNIILFIPLGMAVSWIFKEKRIICKAIYPVLVSCLVEIMQIILDVFNGMVIKLFDVDDIILNGIGGAIGVIVATCIYSFGCWGKNKMKSENRNFIKSAQ